MSTATSNFPKNNSGSLVIPTWTPLSLSQDKTCFQKLEVILQKKSTCSTDSVVSRQKVQFGDSTTNTNWVKFLVCKQFRILYWNSLILVSKLHWKANVWTFSHSISILEYLFDNFCLAVGTICFCCLKVWQICLGVRSRIGVVTRCLRTYIGLRPYMVNVYIKERINDRITICAGGGGGGGGHQ